MILKLPATIISRISAGEVITSPYNVIKECIENSIDANSTQITVDISKDCLSLKISDNGDGIEYNDFPLLCERNCTSKLNDDLLNIQTFGFRGEALCSVSLVSKLKVESKKTNNAIGTEGIYKDGKLTSIKRKAMNSGTVFYVSELFYNYALRKEYFYRRKEEINRIYYLLASYAICYTNVKFIIYIDQNLKEDFNAKGQGLRSDNPFSLFTHKSSCIEVKRDIIQNVYKIDNELLSSRDEQFLALYSNINCSFRQFEFILFINGRLVHSFTLKERIKKIYSAFIPKNRYPFVYIEVYMDNLCVDVNVHPSKKEVIFDDESHFFDKVTTTIKEGFSNNTITLIDQRYKSNDTPVDKLLYADPNASSLIDLFSDRSIEPKFNRVFKLKSLATLKEEFNATDNLFMKDMSYVGEFDHRTLIQDGFNLLLFDIESVLQDYFYQRLLFDIGNNKVLSKHIISESLSERHVLFLAEYFNVRIVDGLVEELITIDRVDISSGFNQFLSEFSTYVMKDEKETFLFVLRKLSCLFKLLYVKNELSFNLLKKKIMYKNEYNENLKVLTSVQQLYKLFDRC